MRISRRQHLSAVDQHFAQVLGYSVHVEPDVKIKRERHDTLCDHMFETPSSLLFIPYAWYAVSWLIDRVPWRS